MTAGPPALAAAAPTAPTHLLYLHGFRSSPASFKARMLAGWLARHRPSVQGWCPQLPPSPAEAWALIRRGTEGWPAQTMAVVGSSLGGFYAAALAEARGCRAVLLNPAVNPARDLAGHLGEQPHWHDPASRFTFTEQHLHELRALTPPGLTRLGRYAAVIARGDELLDWREMAAHLAGAHLRIVDGSDHALSDFEAHLPFVLGWLGLVDGAGAPAPQPGA